MPVVHPADLWRESGRYDEIGPEMARFKDRGDRDMVLAMTHEEVVADLLRDIVRSYRQLPIIVYHFQTKFRDEPRSRGGLIRVREFVMKDSYSCDRDEAGLDTAYWAHHRAYTRIFERLGLEAIPVSSDVGMMGGSLAHEFMVAQPGRRGRARPVRGVRLRERTSRSRRSSPTSPAAEDAAPRRGGRDARHDHDRRARDVPRRAHEPHREGRVLRHRRRPVRRRDRPRRLRRQRDQARATRSRPSAGCGPRRSRRSRRAGCSPGYGSPIGAPRRGRRGRRAGRAAARTSSPARTRPAGTCGTSTCPATTRPTSIADISNVREGDRCPNGGGTVILRNGIEVGNIFKLGTKYTEGARAPSTSARTASATRSSWARTGSGSGATSPCIVEAHHDEKGIIWPAEVAPYPAHLVAIGANKEPRVTEIAERLHELRGRRRPRPRDPVRRPRRVAGRQVHRRRAAGHALDPDRQPAVARGRRRRGHGPRDRREDRSGRSRTSRRSWSGASRRPA